jgi:hypothetical protein
MPAQPDIANDLLVTDGLEEVRVHFPGTDRSRVVPHVLRSAVSVREAAASGGTYTVQDAKFNLMHSEFASDLPEVGGLIEAFKGTELWSITALDKAGYAGTYRAWCKRSILRSALTEPLQIQAANFAKSDDLVAKRSWHTIGNALGKIQEVAQELVVEHERRRVRVTHTIFLPGETVVAAGQRIVDSAGVVYHVLRYTGKDILGDLTAIDCELARTPQPK